MYVVKMMTNREEGYRVVAQRESLAEAQAMAKAMKMYHEPIDVYVTRERREHEATKGGA